jgi:Cthe_2314-like HEPN
VNVNRDRPRQVRYQDYVRYVLPSDRHAFIGRIYDLSIVADHFDNYNELSECPDCKYALDTNYYLTGLVRRVESLNLVGSMLWPDPMPRSFADFPVSRYEWLILAADVFLMRYVSVVDCALILVNTVYESGLEPKKCSVENLKKRGVQTAVIVHLTEMIDDQGVLRPERNARIHHGEERGFTQDDTTFRYASLLEHRSGGVAGTDRFGRTINLQRFFREGLVELQKEFNQVTRRLVCHLDHLYDLLHPEFEARFIPRFRAGPFGSGPPEGGI